MTSSVQDGSGVEKAAAKKGEGGPKENDGCNAKNRAAASFSKPGIILDSKPLNDKFA